jgi:hypothetical protein
MDNEEAIYRKYMEQLKQKLIAKYDELGLRASGSYEESLEYEIQENKLIMWGAHHSIYMENGRDTGPDDYRKIAPFMLQWIETKDSLPNYFRENKHSMAFAIAHKVATEGINVPNQFNKGEVVSSVVNDFLANDIRNMLEELGEVWLPRIRSDVFNILTAA